MQELDFELNGVWASTVGITLQRPVTFTKAVPRRQTFTVSGRNGDLHKDTGTFANRVGNALCYAINAQDVSAVIPSIMAFLFPYNRTVHKLVTSQDTTHFWEVTITNGGELAPRLNLLNPFSIEFDCKPFKTVVGSDVLQNNGTFVNPTGFTSYPLIEVTTATEGATLTCGYDVITFTETVAGITIDCEQECCYSGSANMNNVISCSKFFEFGTGQNTITTNNATIQVAPRWRTL